MKLKTKLLAITLTALFLAMGFLMPLAVSAFDDARLQKQASQIQPIDLQIKTDSAPTLANKLGQISYGYSVVELNSGEYLDKNEALKAAENTMTMLSENGLTTSKADQFTVYDAQPFLAVFPHQPGLSSVLWQCRFTNANGDGKVFSMLIDDATGKMLRLDYMPFENTKITEKTSIYLAPNFKVWAETLAKYYGFTYIDVITEYQGNNSISYKFTFEYEENGKKNSINLSLRLIDNLYVFN